MVNLTHDFFSIGLLKTRNKDGVDRVESIGGGVHAGGLVRMMAVSLCRRLLRRKYPRTSTARDLCAGAQCLERGPRFQQIERRSRATLYPAGAIDFSVTMTICGYATSGCWLMEQVDYNLLYR